MPDPSGLDPLQDISVSAPTMHGVPDNVQDYLDSIPVTLGRHRVVNYPASESDNESVSIATRVPQSWISLIDTIRQMPGTNLPNIWPKRSDFLRWCIQVGIGEIQTIQKRVDDPNANIVQEDPVLAARIMVEKIGGTLAARAEVVTSARKQVDGIAEACSHLMEIGEPAEAAGLIQDWVTSAATQDPYWRLLLDKTLIHNLALRPVIRQLYAAGLIIDEYFEDLCNYAKVFDPAFDDPIHHAEAEGGIPLTLT